MLDMKKSFLISGAIVVILLIAGVFVWIQTRGPETVQEAVEQFEGDQASFYYLDRYILNTGAHDEASVQVVSLLDHEDAAVRFAALYTLIHTGDASDVSAMQSRFDEPDESIRILATVKAVGWGDAEAIPLVIDALSSSEIIPYGHPQQAVASYALNALQVYTGEALTEQADWERWWQRNGEDLTWNADTLLYE